MIWQILIPFPILPTPPSFQLYTPPASSLQLLQAYFHGRDTATYTSSQTCGQALKSANTLSANFSEVLLKGICVNKAEAEIEWSDEAKRWTQKGNKTDCALLAFSFDLGVDYRTLHFHMGDCVRLYPFSSARKRAGIIVPAEGGKFRVYVKGASEIVLALCNKVKDPGTGEESELTEGMKRGRGQDEVWGGLGVLMEFWRGFKRKRCP